VNAELLAKAPVALFVTDAHGVCTFATDRLCDTVGIPAAALRGQHWQVALAGYEVELVEGLNGAIGVVTERTVIDLTDEGSVAHRDLLTGTLSKAGVLAHLGRRLSEARDGVGPLSVGVLMCDIDRFNEINERLGSDAGDELLSAVAGRIAASVRSCDAVGRLEADQFVILTEQDNDADAVALVAERVLELLERPFRLHGATAEVSASIGLTLGDGTRGADFLLAGAEFAMEQAKAAGGKCWRRSAGLRLVRET